MKSTDDTKIIHIKGKEIGMEIGMEDLLHSR